ncbi:hypothetical protein TI05_15425, partial [Achromatium sp. WMS3]
LYLLTSLIYKSAVLTMPSLQQTAPWKALTKHWQAIHHKKFQIQEMFQKDPQRSNQMRLQAVGITLEYKA